MLAFAVMACIGVGSAVIAANDSQSEVIDRMVARLSPDQILRAFGFGNGSDRLAGNDAEAEKFCTQDIRGRMVCTILDKAGNPAGQPYLADENGEPQLGLAVISTSNTGLTNVRIGGVLQRGSSSSTGNYNVSQYDVETFPTGTSSFSFNNGRSSTSTVHIEIVERGIVSSSFQYSCGDSAQTAVAFDSTTPPDQLVAVTDFVTSTFGKVITSLTSTSSISIGPGRNLTCFAQSNFGSGGGGCGDTTGGTDFCEQVSSTNRGWSLDMRAVWQWFDGIQ